MGLRPSWDSDVDHEHAERAILAALQATGEALTALGLLSRVTAHLDACQRTRSQVNSILYSLQGRGMVQRANPGMNPPSWVISGVRPDDMAPALLAEPELELPGLARPDENMPVTPSCDDVPPKARRKGTSRQRRGHDLVEGCLVARRGELARIGKVVSISDGLATLEWFESVASRTTSRECASDLVRVGLEAQTRCYVTDEYGSHWRMGRVMGVSGCRSGTGLEYQIDFPNRTADYVGEARVYVRLSGVAADPVDTLICRGHETPYFHERRMALIRSLVNQRSASAGLTGLLSASIHLYRHQVEVVRAVLHDPVQRYLLADEVGLGKTVEAGIVLRQTLIDDPDATALVLVPPTLVAQWRSELAGKLLLPLERANIIVGAYELAATLSDAKYDMVVIDEAHNVAAGLHRGDGAALFRDIAALSSAAPRLLLLSATPALHNEQDFLAMLHLLDPSTYSLDDVDRFRQMVAARQPVGQFLLAFREGTPRIRMRRMLPRVRELFPSDDLILRYCDELQDCCEQEEYDAERADELIRALRVNVCETYRIYRRMLRASRARLPEGVLSQRSADRQRVPVVEEYSSDDRYELVHDVLEEWRIAAVGYLLSLEEHDRRELEDKLAVVLQALAECVDRRAIMTHFRG